jgi:type II secretory pathway predicted ATPase ExeA
MTVNDTTPKTDRVLSEQMRPTSMEGLVGLDAQVYALKKQFSTGRIPHFFILSGPIGSGKTTLAKILSLELVRKGSGGRDAFSEEKSHDVSHLTNVRRGDAFREINAADKNGIDEIRAVIESMRFQPMPPSKSKVVVFDEAHQLTVPAQNALLTVTEDAPKHAYYIFCTTSINKILIALRRRAYVVNTSSLDEKGTRELLNRVRSVTGENSCDMEPLVDALQTHDVTSPGLVLQAVERYLTGSVSAHEAALASHSDVASRIDTIGISRAISAGNWKACSGMLQRTCSDITRADVHPLKAAVLGYLRKVLLGAAPGVKSVSVAKAINFIANSATEEVSSVASLTASFALACEQLRA